MKTLLIILAFVVITILVFKPFHSCRNNDMVTNTGSDESEEHKECYSPSFDSKYVDPRVSPYSRDITFRPDTDDVYGLDDPMNTDPDKLLDHLSDQNKGLNEFDNNIDTDPKNNMIHLRHEFANNKRKQLMFMRERQQKRPDQGMREYMGSGENPESIFHPMSSSYTNTEINGDIVRESNNIARYCVNSQPDVGMMTDDKGKVLPDGIDKPYSAMIDDISELEMDMDNKQYYDLISDRPEHKTYIQIDDAFGRFNQNAGDGKVKTVDGLADITKVMDAYRNNTLDSINGAYRNGRSTVGNKSGKRMYDIVN